MPVTISGSTGVTFNDATTQSTAAVGSTTLYALGTYITGRPANATNYTVNATVAGSSLYSTLPNAYWSLDGWAGGTGGTYPNQTLVNTGSWRCMSAAGGGGGYGQAGLWVRYA